MARDVHNKGRSRTLAAKLEGPIADAAEHAIDIKSNPRTAVWNEAHRQFNSNPNKFPPAHCALLKRVQKPGTHIPFINRIVAIMNIDALGEQSEARVVEIRDRVAGMLTEFCQAEIETTLMTPSNLMYQLAI